MVNISEQAATAQMKFTGTIDIETYVGVDPSTVSIKFYNSLTTLLLALSKGEIDSITVPRPVGRYILENNYGDFNIKGFNWWIKAKSSTLNFSFVNEELAKKFNEIISAMKQNGTLAALEKKYIENFDTMTTETFENFDDAETITVAVTGDIPRSIMLTFQENLQALMLLFLKKSVKDFMLISRRFKLILAQE